MKNLPVICQLFLNFYYLCDCFKDLVINAF